MNSYKDKTVLVTGASSGIGLAMVHELSNQDYWKPKLNRNKERFKEVREKLESDGWNVMVVWECETRNIDKLVITIDDITNGIMKQLRN